MPPWSSLSLFIPASLALLLIPGPAVLFIVARSGAHGVRAGVFSVLGVHAGSIVHVGAAVAGLSAIVVASATAFTVVRVVGGLYLVLLGVRAWRAAGTLTPLEHTPTRSVRRVFVEGFVVNLLNPKAIVFFSNCW